MVDDLPQEIKLYLRVEAMRRGVNVEDLLTEILAGGNPLPPHISDLIRALTKARLSRAYAE